jgi:hypothetical protein
VIDAISAADSGWGPERFAEFVCASAPAANNMKLAPIPQLLLHDIPDITVIMMSLLAVVT